MKKANENEDFDRDNEPVDILRARAQARSLLSDSRRPPLLVLCNVGGIKIADDQPRVPNYEFDRATIQSPGRTNQSFELAEGESVDAFISRVCGAAPALGSPMVILYSPDRADPGFSSENQFIPRILHESVYNTAPARFKGV